MDNKKAKPIEKKVEQPNRDGVIDAINLHYNAQELAPSSIIDVIAFPLESTQQKIKCGLCSKVIGAQGSTLYNKKSHHLICLENDQMRTNVEIHLFHTWCLSDYIMQNMDYEKEESIVPCPTCTGLKYEIQQSPTRIGIDIGGVIISQAERQKNNQQENSEDTELGSGLETPGEPYCFESIKTIVEKLGSENVFIVSKCGKGFRDKTLSWLENKGFYKATGFNPKNLHFCEERAQKRPICEDLKITHFIDDRIDVLKHLCNLPLMRTCFVYKPVELSRQGNVTYFYPNVTKTYDWHDVCSSINK